MPLPSLFRNRNFLMLWLASIIGNFTLAVAMLAETWYVVKTLDAKEQLGYVMIAGSVPRILLMAVGGVLADRFKRGHIVMVSMGVRVLLLFALIVLLHYGRLDIVALTIFAFLYGALDAFFWPAQGAIIPSIVPEAELTRANSIMLTTNQIGLVFGPTIGTALLALFSYESVFGMAGIGLLLGAACMLLLNEPPPVPRTTSDKPGSAMLHELKEGLLYTLQTPVLRSMMIIYAFANLLFMGPLSIGIPLVVTQHLDGEVTTLGFLQSAGAAGMVAGGILLTLFPPKSKRLMMITLVIAAEGVLLALQGHTYWVWLAIGIQFLLGLGIVSNNVPMMSVIQQYSDRDKIGRVMSLNNMASMGLSPISYAMVTGLLALHVSIGWIMPIFGLAMSAAMLWCIFAMPVVRQSN
ncbi:MFS transporter [Chitinilyticum aquatile]|uniref:MFS transporter n=1 Tax=Chitinilyticum aquatile TaxID=362520 RepID=UPI00041C9DE5|nr:MFS transporter [Chitinilyticum aquatile]